MTTPTKTESTSGKAIAANLVLVRQTGETWNQLVHDTAVMVMEHSITYNDCRMAKDLAFAMPASTRRTCLIQWFHDFSPIRMNLENNKVGYIKEGAGDYRPFDLDAAKAMPWFMIAEANKEITAKAFNLAEAAKLLKALTAKIEKAVEKGTAPDNEFTALTELAVMMTAIRIPVAKPVATNENTDKIPTPVPSGEETGLDSLKTLAA